MFDNLTAGSYTISVTDNLGCPVDFTNAFTLVTPDPIAVTLTATDLACAGDVDASITATVALRNVTPNYQYRLNSYADLAGTTLLNSSVAQNSATFDNLSAGFYSVTVFDDINCSTESLILEIENPDTVQGQLITNQIISCQQNGEIQLIASGGTGPYLWSEDGVNFNAMNNAAGADTHVFINVVPGNYQYYVQDSFNCVSTVSNTLQLTPPDPIGLESLDLSAATINCNGENSAIISARANGGLGDYQYALFSDATLLNEIRPNQVTGIFPDLTTGTYYIRIQSGDCEFVSNEIEITEPPLLEVTPNITNVSCSGESDGSITLDVVGGTADYQFAISPNLNQFDDVNTFTNLSAGDYTVIVQDANGCIEVLELEVIEPPTLRVDTRVEDEICFGSEDGAIILTIIGGTAPYETSLNSTDDSSFELDRVLFSDLGAGEYVVFVRDALGCTTNTVVTVNSGVDLAGEATVTYNCDIATATALGSVEITLQDTSILNDVLYGLDTTDPALMVTQNSFDNLSGGPIL